MRKENILKDKSFSFALRMIELYKILHLSIKNTYFQQIPEVEHQLELFGQESENAASFKDFLN